MMTNSEAIKQLKFLKKVDFHIDTKEACDIAIFVLEENDKLKAEIEHLKQNIIDGANDTYSLQKLDHELLTKEIEQLKEDYSVLERQYNNVENSSIRYYNEVKQLKSELEQSVKLPLTNADKIRSMNDEELAEFLSENTNCDCCNIQCIDKLNCPSMSSCLFRFMEWLKSEVSE